VVVEAKFRPKGASGLERLIRKMRSCGGTAHAEHRKCEALQVVRPDFFLGVAASETWRLFPVIHDRNGRLVLGDPLPSDDPCQHLRFGP
jgi:hypothetical protein